MLENPTEAVWLPCSRSLSKLVLQPRKHDSKAYSLNHKNKFSCLSFYSNKKEIIRNLCGREVQTRLKREPDILLPS